VGFSLGCLAVIVMLFSGGCGRVWVHPMKDHAAYEHDMTQCQAEGFTSAVGAPDPLSQSIITATRTKQCMKNRGWQIESRE
jgi:hypothetical protein